MEQQPLYARIADQLSQDIASGRYPVGTVLPTEPDLAALLKVSRSTVRAALSSLENRKLVSRKKNAGTRVESDKPQTGYGANLSSLPDLIQWAQECARAVQHTDTLVMSPNMAKELGCAPHTLWLWVQSLRLDPTRHQEAVSLTDAYIDARFASLLPSIEERPSALMSALLEEVFGLELATVEQEVHGWKLTAEQARILQADPDSAALKVLRRYFTPDHQPVLVTVSIHPADRFSIKTTLTRT
jgi:DNA-binding GntR family transcriptional regulator